MIIHVRCFSCSSVIGNNYELYSELLDSGLDKNEILDKYRYCCRRMILTRIDFIDKLLKYNLQS